MKQIFAILFLTLSASLVGFSQNAGNTVTTLFIDNSGSLRSDLLRELEIAEAIISSASRHGRLSICYFGTPTESGLRFVKGTDWLEDRNSLTTHLDSVDTVGGLTALRDAMRSAAIGLSEVAVSEQGVDKRLIVITDGEDQRSFFTTEQLLNTLKERKIRVSVVALYESPDVGLREGSFKLNAKAFVERIVKETNGRLVVRKKNQSAAKIADELFKEQ